MSELSVQAGPSVREWDCDHAFGPVPYDVREEFCVFRPGAWVGEKQYAFAAMGFVLSGWTEYRAQTGSAMALPGAVVLANRGDYFTCRHGDVSGSRRLVVRFSDDFLEDVAEDCHLADTRIHAIALPPDTSAAKIFGWMRRLSLELPGQDDAAYALAAIALNAQRAKVAAAPTSIRNERRMQSALRYIETSYAEPCSLKTLSNVVGLSRYYFIRAFKAVTGVSPNQYLIHTRLRAAADLLLTTKAPVGEIAFGVGFNDLSHFNASFRAAFGCAPTTWRAGAGP